MQKNYCNHYSYKQRFVMLRIAHKTPPRKHLKWLRNAKWGIRSQ